MGEDRFEAIEAKTGFEGEGFGVGVVLVQSSAMVNGVGGGRIANSTAGKTSVGVEMKPLSGEFIFVGLEIADGSIGISIWNGELGPSFQVFLSSSVAGILGLLTTGESSKD